MMSRQGKPHLGKQDPRCEHPSALWGNGGQGCGSQEQGTELTRLSVFFLLYTIWLFHWRLSISGECDFYAKLFILVSRDQMALMVLLFVVDCVIVQNIHRLSMWSPSCWTEDYTSLPC